MQGGPQRVGIELRSCWVWSDQGGPWLEVGCGKLMWKEPAAGLSWQLMKALEQPSSITGWSCTKTCKSYLPSWQGPEQGCGWFGGEASVRRGIGAQICIQRRFSQAPSSHTAAPSLGAGSGPSSQVILARPGLSCCLEYHKADSAADVPSQAWLHLPAARETTEVGGLKWPNLSLGLEPSHPSWSSKS